MKQEKELEVRGFTMEECRLSKPTHLLARAVLSQSSADLARLYFTTVNGARSAHLHPLRLNLYVAVPLLDYQAKSP